MANNVLGILVNLTVKGRDAVKGVSDDLKGLDKASGGVTSGLGKMAVTLGTATAAIAGVGLAAKATWSIMKEGAALDLTARRFDNLTASINTTSDALMDQLRGATSGMISDMALMQSASQIISLKLADTSDQVVRLSAVSGQLGWDMQQVILTFANMSTMRLDALGLSVEEVTSKAKELEAAGMTAQQAFKEAVIQAGEARLGTLGSEADTAAGSLKKAEAAVINLKDALLLSTTATLDQAGAFDLMAASAGHLNSISGAVVQMGELRDAGELTTTQLLGLVDMLIRRMPPAAITAKMAQIEMQNALTDTEEELATNQGAWGAWAIGIAQSQQVAVANSRRMAAEMNAAFMAAAQGDPIEWAGGMGGGQGFDYIGAAQERNKRMARWAQSANNRARQEDARRSLITRDTEAMTSYGGAVSYAISQEDALAAAHARLADAFTAEITAKPEEGLINAEGLVNVQAMTESLYDQARAAGAGAVELAMLGVATGKFTKEQAAAALKAAVLQEQIKKIAAGVADGSIKYDAAVQHLEAFRQKLDASGGGAEGATANVEELVGMAEELTQGPYAADINANTTQAQADLQATLDLIRGIEGVHQATVVVDTQNTGPEERAGGGPVLGGRPYMVGEVGPELFVPGGNGYIVPNNQLGQFQSAGSTVTVQVTNYVNGQHVNRAQLDDITEDRLKHAMRAMGVV